MLACARPLAFASEQELMDALGLLKDREHKVTFFLDKSFLEGSGLIRVCPNVNNANVWLKAEDLLQLLQENGTQSTLFEA